MWQRGITAGALAISAAFAAVPAAAQTTAQAGHVYAGGTLGQARWSSTCANCEKRDTALRVFGGYQINRILAAEIGFANLGEQRGPDQRVKGTAWDASLVAGWPVAGPLSVFGRAGVQRSNLKGSGALAGQQHDRYALTYGLGAQFDLTPNLGLRLDWQEYSTAGGAGLPDTDIQFISAGAVWRFR